MKLLLVFVASIAYCAGTPTLRIPGDNSHYVEGESRYIWMPDGDGVPHLVDLLERPSEEEELSRDLRNGANNEYWLYTRDNPSTTQFLVHGDENSVIQSNYKSDLALKVIVHGWNGNGNSGISPKVRDAFLEVEDCNVIVVDWRRLAKKIYWTAVRGVPDVGTHLGNFLEWLIQTAGGDFNRVHLVGFSLGAHIVGNAGRTLDGKVARITGLDPAGPNFGGNSNALKADDAVYVEAIHTDGGNLGIFDPIAQVNFYPNGGRTQPGCLISTCSHSRAYDLYASTVLHNHLVGRSCSSLKDARKKRCRGSAKLEMGNHHLDKQGDGLYGLTTDKRWPY